VRPDGAMYEPDPESLDLAEAIRKGLIPTIPGFLEEMIRQKPPLPKETKSKYSEKAPAAGPRERATREARRNVLSVPNAVGRKLARHFDPSAGAHLHQPTGSATRKPAIRGEERHPIHATPPATPLIQGKAALLSSC